MVENRPESFYVSRREFLKWFNRAVTTIFASGMAINLQELWEANIQAERETGSDIVDDKFREVRGRIGRESLNTLKTRAALTLTAVGLLGIATHNLILSNLPSWSPKKPREQS